MVRYIAIEYSGGVRPSAGDTTYERRYGKLSSSGQRIQSGVMLFEDSVQGREQAREFTSSMKYMGYGFLQRRYQVNKDPESGQIELSKTAKGALIAQAKREWAQEAKEGKTLEAQKLQKEQYKINGVGVTKAEYEQKKLQAEQKASKSWAQQKVKKPIYSISKIDEDTGEAIAMPVSKEIYTKFKSDVGAGKLEGYQADTITAKGYSPLGQVMAESAFISPALKKLEVRSTQETPREYFQIGGGSPKTENFFTFGDSGVSQQIQNKTGKLFKEDSIAYNTPKIEVYPTAIREKIKGIKPVTSFSELDRRLFTEIVYLPPATPIYEKYIEPNIDDFTEKYGDRTILKGETYRDFTKFMTGVPAGAYEGVRTQPSKVILSAGIGYVAGFAFGAVRSGVTALSVATGTQATSGIAWSGLQIAGGGALAYTYVSRKAVEVQSQPSYYGKGMVVGSALSTEVLPTAVGFKQGETGFVALQNYIRTRGYQYVPLESITPTEVASGKVKYWNRPEYQHMGLFQEGKYNLPKTKYDIAQIKVGDTTYNVQNVPRVYHASTSLFGSSTAVGAGSSELPAFYVAPQLSVPFLRTSSSLSNYRPTITTELGGFPTGYNIQPIGYDYLPSTGKSEFISNQAIYGKVYVGTGKTEVEGLIRADTILVKETIPRSSRFYTDVDSINIPLEKYYALPAGSQVPAGVETTTLGEVSQFSSYDPYSFSISSYAGALGLLNIPSSSKQLGTSSLSSSTLRPSISLIPSRSKPFLSYSSPSRSSSLNTSYSYAPLSAPSLSYSSPKVSIVQSISRSSLRPSSISLSPSITKLTSSSSSSTSGSSYTPPPSSLVLPKLNLSQAVRKIKVVKVTNYTPSFSALVFNIKGMAPSLRAQSTGLAVRPITKGMTSFFNPFKQNFKINFRGLRF